jgi:hypothetical protein
VVSSLSAGFVLPQQSVGSNKAPGDKGLAREKTTLDQQTVDQRIVYTLYKSCCHPNILMKAYFMTSFLRSRRNVLSLDTRPGRIPQNGHRYFPSLKPAIFSHGNRRFCDYGAYLMIFYLELCFKR